MPASSPAPQDPAAMIAQTTPPRSPDISNAPSENPEPEPTADQEKPEEGIDIPLPEGFQPPADAKAGKTFTALATLRMDDDGDLSLVALDGAKVSPEKEEEPKGAPGEEPEGEQASPPASMQEALQQGLPKTGMPA